MYIYILLLFLISCLLIISKSGYLKRRNAYLIIAILITLIIGCRNVSMGQYDTERVYMPYFYRILNNDLSYVFTLKDVGFQLVTYVFTRLIGDNFQLYIFLFAIPYASMITYMIYKYSKYPIVSFVFFICLQYFEISFTLMRQVNAMALLLLSTHYMITQKNKRAVLCIFLASLYHQTSLIYLLMFCFKNFKLKKKYIPYIVACSFIFLILPSQVMNFIFNVLGDDNRFYIYLEKGQQKTFVFYLLNLVIWISCLIAYRFSNSSRDRNIFFLSATIALYLSPLTLILGEMSRIVYYFGVYEIIIFPDIFSRFNKKDKGIVAFVIVTMFIFYFLFILGPSSNVIPYTPFF